MPRENPPSRQDADSNAAQDGALDDLLQETRILLQGAQVLTAFLIILPFNQGFSAIKDVEKWVYLATFLCSITSLVLFTAPAAHHRLIRPLTNRESFKNFATRMTIIGLVTLSLALTLSSFLVVAQVADIVVGSVAAVGVGLLILVVWWVLAFIQRTQMQPDPDQPDRESNSEH